MGNNSRPLSKNNPRVERLTISRMVCEDLGYCCLYAFLSLYKDNALVATRLGVTTRAIRYHRAKMPRCEEAPTCLSRRGKLAEEPKE